MKQDLKAAIKQSKNELINDIEELKEEKKLNLKKSKEKLIFFVKQGLDSFLNDIIVGLSKEYEIKKILVTEYKQIDEGMKWADICWFEWCDELIEYGSKLELSKEKKIICRLHSYEAFSGYIDNVNWNNVDALMLICNHIKNFVIQNFNIDENIIRVIPNGVDDKKWEFKENEKGFKIAYAGYINYKKGPMLLLHTFKAIYEKDHRYKLYIAGMFQDNRDVLYYNQMINEFGLQNNIIYEGWREDLDKWLDDKNYILCTSVLESQNMSVMQAMCKGIKPIIHNFVGAKGIYPSNYVWNTIDEAVNMIGEDKYVSREYRDYIIKNYSYSNQLNKIIKLISDLCLEKNSKESIKEPLVTVGITNYNNSRFLEQCIQSVFNQNYKNMELIIVDDCSNDDSVEKLQSYEKKYPDIKVIYHNTNSGSPDLGRREIIKNAKGDYFILCDSDDFFQNKYAIKKLIDAACKDMNVDYVYCNLEVVNNKNEKISRWQYEQYDGRRIVLDIFKHFGSGALPMKGLFKNNFFKNNNIEYLSNGTAGDTLTSLLCIKNNMKVKFLDEDLICYRQHDNNFTFDVSKRIKAVVNIEEYIISNFDETIFLPEIKWESYNGQIRKAAKAYLIGNHYFNLLNAYYEGKWIPWNNSKILNEENILVYLNETKDLIIKYFSESCTLSTVFIDEILTILKKIEEIFGIRIVLNNTKLKAEYKIINSIMEYKIE